MAHQHYLQESRTQLNQPNPSFPFDSLYCSEEHWEEEVEDDHFFKEGEVEERYFSTINNRPNSRTLLEQDLVWEEEELITLLSKEQPNKLHKNLNIDPFLSGARKEAVEWILKVNARYSFSALTAVLAVDYLDRFLSGFQFQREKPWTTQLVAVASISLAAKVEETQVPLLLDLQVEDSIYVFEAKTIKRMEILVLSTLQWRMNPVTPLSIIDYIIRRLGLNDYYLCWEFLRRCERTLLSVISDSRCMAFLPSEIASAIVLQVVNSIEPCLAVEYQTQLLSILGITKDKVEGCTRLIVEASSPASHGNQLKRKLCSIPSSPNGVIDLSLSSYSSNDSWVTDSLPKKGRIHEQQLLEALIHKTSTADFLSIPR